MVAGLAFDDPQRQSYQRSLPIIREQRTMRYGIPNVVSVYGNHGSHQVDPFTGVVLTSSDEYDRPLEPGRYEDLVITRFDVFELARHHDGMDEDLPGVIDILSIGYWYWLADGVTGYETPVRDDHWGSNERISMLLGQ